MSWKHGDEPTMHFKFKVFIENLALCHFDFEVTSFEAHLVEKLADQQNTENEKFYTEAKKCAQELINYQRGPAEDKAIEQELVEFNNILLENPTNKVVAEEVEDNIAALARENHKKVVESLKKLFAEQKKQEETQKVPTESEESESEESEHKPSSE